LAYQNLGQLNHARGAYERALKIEPDFKEARDSLKKLK
jgi:Tfp pilus assembly protein PilF